MKTIIENATNLSKYLLEDSVVTTASQDSITVGNPVEFIIGDMNEGNATVYENVDAPADWSGNKYTFDGTTWTLNPNWVVPTLVEE